MKRYRGGDDAPPGVYLNPRAMSFHSVQRAAPLPGDWEDKYQRVPAVAAIVIGSALGGLYVIALPLIGCAVLGWIAGVKALELIAAAAVAAVRVFKPSWRPARASFAPSARTRHGQPGTDLWLEEVKKELEREAPS